MAWLAAALLAAASLALATPAVAAPLPPAACAACPALAARGGLDATPEAAELCSRALSVLAALGQWRSAFLAAPHYTNLFPTVYWHVTRMELVWVAEGRHDAPQEVLRQIDLFYDAYAWNRTRFEAGQPTEPHWHPHFATAAEADRQFGQVGRGMAFDTPETVRRVLATGVLAHIAFDLPRSLRAGAGATRLAEPAVAADFRRAAAIFPAVGSAFVAEIHAAVRATSDWDAALLRPAMLRWFGDLFDEMRDDVLRLRQAAWQVAVGPGPLPTGDAPHPPPMPRPPVDCPG